jgi:hypothetical protein
MHAWKHLRMSAISLHLEVTERFHVALLRFLAE